MRRLLLALLLVMLYQPLSAVAQQAGAFARVGFGARGIALGNAVTADATGFASPFYNPALAPFLSRQSLDVSAALMTLDRQLQFVQLSTPLRPRAGIAGGLVHATVGGFDGRDISGYHTGKFSISEFAFFVAFGVSISSRTTVGLGFQLFRSDLFANVSAARSIGIDLGMSHQFSEQLRVGVVLDDLLAEYNWNTSEHHAAGGNTRDRFPQRLRVGASYQLSGVHLSAEFESRFMVSEARVRKVELSGNSLRETTSTEALTTYESRFRAGAEYYFVPAMAVRGGATSLGQGALRPSAGFAVEQPLDAIAIRAEYTFVLEPYAMGTIHLVTLRFFL